MLELKYQYIRTNGHRRFIFRFDASVRTYTIGYHVPDFGILMYSKRGKLKEVNLNSSLRSWLDSHTPGWGMAVIGTTRVIDLFFQREDQALSFRMRWL